MNNLYKVLSIVGGFTLISGCSMFHEIKEKRYDRKHDYELIVHMKDTKTGKEVGTVTISPYEHNGKDQGMIIHPHLYNLPASSTHGFHVHVNADCSDNGQAAGGHWDPDNANKHLGPYDDNGRKGDLPVLIVDPDGTATKPILAPRLDSLEDLVGHSLVVHVGSDNYSDSPEPLGGGGDRMLCGIIKD